MKIAIVGTGALGSYYGAKLCRDGQDVHFLLRSDYEHVRRRGVAVHSPEGDFHVNPKTARLPGDIGVVDLVVICLKTTANSEFARLLTPLVGTSTALLTLQNGLGNEEALAALFGREKIMGGLCFVAINRIGPGFIRHIAQGKIVMGEFSGYPEPRTHDVATIFRHSGVPCSVTDNLKEAHWEKLVWNIAFNGLGVASAIGYEGFVSDTQEFQPSFPPLSSDLLLADPRWEKLVRALMAEVITTAQAMNLKVSFDQIDHEISRTKKMGVYKASTIIDFEHRQPLEVVSLFESPLALTRQMKVPAPILERLCQILRKIDPAASHASQ
ncbi:MAG: 2-dehydropantoate 2-reductase [Verrucomicrobiales bacterium]|nr:2-dehydropantoate 2-reductase [Verrucomicrobiales bacterium]